MYKGKRSNQKFQARHDSVLSTIPALEKLRQEDCHEFRESLGFIMKVCLRNKIWGDEKRAQWTKCFPSEHEDLLWVPSYHMDHQRLYTTPVLQGKTGEL